MQVGPLKNECARFMPGRKVLLVCPQLELRAAGTT